MHYSLDNQLTTKGVTAELLKDIITIFYAPLAQVYKAASIADSLGDLQNFLNDMIRTVEQVEEREYCLLIQPDTDSTVSQEDPQRTVQTFIDLVQRHEQAFYSFVHNVHSKGQGLFDSLMAWIELFLSYAREGIAQPLDLEFILPHGGETRAKIMAEVDAVAQYHYKLKVAHEEKVRRRFDKGVPASNDEAELLGSVMASLSIGETTMGDAEEIAEEESDDDDDEGQYYSEDDEEPIRSAPHSASEGQGQKEERNPYVPMPTPDHIGSDLPPLTFPTPGGKKKQKDSDRERRGSSGSKSGKMDKIKSTLHRRSIDATNDREKEREHLREKKERPAPIQVPKSERVGDREHDKKSARRARERAARANMVMPETPAIDELRPLFTEVVSDMRKARCKLTSQLRPLLVVKPLNTLPPTVKP